MDVISLYQNNIKTAVAPLGTSLTETQLLLSWKYANKPTIMFDGDSAGLRASYKSALMSGYIYLQINIYNLLYYQCNTTLIVLLINIH